MASNSERNNKDRVDLSSSCKSKINEKFENFVRQFLYNKQKAGFRGNPCRHWVSLVILWRRQRRQAAAVMSCKKHKTLCDPASASSAATWRCVQLQTCRSVTEKFSSTRPDNKLQQTPKLQPASLPISLYTISGREETALLHQQCGRMGWGGGGGGEEIEQVPPKIHHSPGPTYTKSGENIVQSKSIRLGWVSVKADSQYNFLRRDMRLATHATSCDSDTRFTIFFMFATSSCTSSTMHVHCTYTARAPRVETVLHLCMSRVACRKSWTFFNFCDRCIATACDSLRQLATGSFLSQLSQIACRVAESCIVNRP